MDRKVINNNKNNIYFPMDWEIVSISSIADIEGGKRLPRGHKLTDTNTLFPYIRIVDFKNMSADKKNIKYINPSTKEIIANYTISSKDVYLTIAGTVGLAGLIPIELDGANLTENAVKICNLRDVIKEYLAYVLNFSFIKKQISAFIGKAQQPKLAIFRIKKIKIPLPKIKEQEKIAEILLNMDKTINEVSNAIKKAENLKKGLMQKLLTRGIGHKEFKYTEIGKIPDNWQIEKIENIFNIFGGTTPSTSVKEFWNGNINWVTPSDLNKLLQNIYLIQTEKKITEEAVKKYSLNIFNENNILLSTRASIGLVAINKFPVTINQGMTALIPKNKSTISPYYFMYYFSWIKKYLNQLAAGSTFREISKSTIRNINVCLPEFKEQEKIAEILSATDERVQLLKEKKQKLESVKVGLMNDLLIGRKRVKLEA